MLKKLLVSLLSALLCMSVVAETESQLNGNQNETDVKIDENGDVFVSPLWYHISSDSTAEVKSDDSYKEHESVVIPSEIRVDGHVYSVTSIGDKAFDKCHSLTSIEIPSSVTSIGYYAFSGCSGLTSIKIPSGVTRIGNYAFSECYSLTSIEIPSSVTRIGYYAFSECYSLTNIEIPSGVTSIRSGAFSDCKNLDVIIDNSEKNISVGENAFKNCKSVKYLK